MRRACGICGTDLTFVHMGGMSEYLLIENAVAGRSVAVFPDSVPFDVASLKDAAARLTEMHGQGANALGQPRPDTDV